MYMQLFAARKQQNAFSILALMWTDYERANLTLRLLKFLSGVLREKNILVRYRYSVSIRIPKNIKRVSTQKKL